jgi:protein tyrosine phosphatase (PTP) superfamily phosphohydrolase (DUF442 family)
MAMLATPSESELLARPKPRRRKSLVTPKMLVRLGLMALIVFFGYEAGRRLVGSNFHTVLPGRVYRGAQPTAGQIEALAREHGIRTIINLRGCGLPEEWYDEETRASQRLGLNQEDLSFSALRLPSAGELRRLVEVLDGAEYPVYLHCRRGADRTGMAAAMVLLLQTDKTYAESRSQLGLWYGHLSFGKTGVLDRFFDLYEDWLAKEKRSHDRATFRHWLLNEYQGGWCHATIEECKPLQAQARKGEPIGFRVRVRNQGTKEWPLRASALAGVHLGYQIWDGENLLAYGRAGLRDANVPAGTSIPLTLVVAPLPRAGRFRLLVDMVEEGHCWFYQAGSEPHEEELVVAD